MLLLVLLTSRAYLWTTSSVLLTRVAHQEFKLLIWLRLYTRLVNRNKDLIATTDAHRLPVRVHAQRPGKGLQAKQSESLRAQDSAIQKPDQNRNNMSHSLYNHPYALNHIQLVKWTFDIYEKGCCRTGFNTLDNWGHKTPTQSKKEKREKKS